MITIKDIVIKNSINEFSLKEWENITAILNDKQLESVEKYLNILNEIGISDEELSKLDMDDLFKYIASLKKSTIKNSRLIDKIVIGDHTYVAHTGTFKLMARDLSIIQKESKMSNKFLVKAISTIFKRSDLSITEHYDPTHIESKMEMFANQPVKLFFNYIIYISKKIAEKIQHADTETSNKLA